MWDVTRQRRLVLALALMVLVVGCLSYANSNGLSSQPQEMTFENVTAGSGLNYSGTGRGIGNGNNGVYAGDVNDDSWTDLLVLGGQQPALFINDGGAFQRRASFPTVTKNIKSATLVDYDGDGWEDIILFAVRDAPIVLHNDGGEFQRSDIELGNLTYPLGATVTDYDGDGDLDMFVYQSGDWSENKPAGFLNPSYQIADNNGNPNVLYENTGDGFERANVTRVSGERWSLAASFVDLTGDGRPDIHVANDFNNDTVYINRGDGTFEQRFLGEATARNGMSSTVGDINGDNQPEIFVSNIYLPIRENQEQMSEERYQRLKRHLRFVIQSGRTKGNTLLVNQAGGEFTDKASKYGVRKGGWGWAASLTDFTNDGRLDLVQVTQNVVPFDPDSPKWTCPMVWRNQADNATFARVDPSTHGIADHDARGMATLDYDNDGDRDIVIATYHGPLVLYENTVDDSNSVQFEVVNEQGAPAFGATVTVQTGDGTTTTVRQTDENDYLSQESHVVHVGLGDVETVTLAVSWPDGTERTFEVAADRQLRLTKGGVEVTANFTERGGG